MPTYVYKFTETGETVEVQQAFSDDSLTEVVHPATGTTMTVKKVFTPVGVERADRVDHPVRADLIVGYLFQPDHTAAR